MIELFANIVSGFQSLIHSFPMHSFSTRRRHQKTSCFQGVEKKCIGNEWVNYFHKTSTTEVLQGLMNIQSCCTNEHLQLFKDDLFNVQFQQPYYFNARAFRGMKISWFRAEFREKYFLSSTAKLKCCKIKFLAQNAKLKCRKKIFKSSSV